jgi:Cupin-like domain
LQIDLALAAATIAQRYPDFPGLDAAHEVTLTAGQMLYLPAGWFHEVTSSSGSSDAAHVAVNFWFHPPDNLDPGSATSRPYLSGYWSDLWNERVRRNGWADALLVPLLDAAAGATSMAPDCARSRQSRGGVPPAALSQGPAKMKRER